jgi:hypothetical protein
LTSPALETECVNGDGLDDLIIGALYADSNGKVDTGKSYIVFGKQDNTAINLSAIAAGTGGFDGIGVVFFAEHNI